jgi:beta-phosphoglucomutase-like phosphatase (HAD superfamily)
MIYPEIHPQAKALIFDLDGTLADSIPIHIHCWHETCKTFGYKFKEDVLYEMTGMPTLKFAEYIKKDSGCNLSVNEIMRLKQGHFYQLAHTIKPIKIMVGFVKNHYGKIPMSIGTGGGRRSSELILKAIDMLEYFNIIVTADDVTNYKPEPDTFLKCADLMGIDPKYCQVFEDGKPGMDAACQAGMIVTDVRKFYGG